MMGKSPFAYIDKIQVKCIIEFMENLVPGSRRASLEVDALRRQILGLPPSPESDGLVPQLTEDQRDYLAPIAKAEQQAISDRLLQGDLPPEAHLDSDVPAVNSANLTGINIVRADWNGTLGGGTPGNPWRVPKTDPRFDA